MKRGLWHWLWGKWGVSCSAFVLASEERSLACVDHPCQVGFYGHLLGLSGAGLPWLHGRELKEIVMVPTVLRGGS